MKYFPWLCLLILTDFASAQSLPVNIIPRPQKIDIQDGYFQINGHTAVLASKKDSAAWSEAKSLVAEINGLTGLHLIQLNADEQLPAEDYVLFKNSAVNSGDEGYTIDIDANRIILDGHSEAGLFYACQSFGQLLPPEIMARPILRTGGTVRLQAMTLEDHPRFGWRGMHLDVSRHFFDKAFIRQYLDYMASLKMNVFHWHLTDSQGWRLEIKKYPRLTDIGAFRVQRPNERFAEARPQKTGELVNYGGYYTQQDVREIIAYARARHITILPEIDMPGHSMAALAAYPQFASIPGPIAMPSGQLGAYTNSLNPGNDSTYTFLEDILTEVIALFPGEYIHIGGDEVDRAIWKDNLLCQQKMKRENLHSLDELQSYFIRRIESFIRSKGKKMIGWDEIIEGGLAPAATVMSWRGYKGGLIAARANHNVVMAPALFTYFDLYQGDPKLEPQAYSHNLLSTSYQFDPVPGELKPEDRKYILGGHGCLWTETVPDIAHIEHMLFPRVLALAESEWSAPNRKNFDSFKLRLAAFRERLDFGHIAYARSGWNVWIRPIRDTADNKMTIACSTELGQGQIFYTLDGTMPGPEAHVYTRPFQISGNTLVKAASFGGTKLISEINDEQFELSKTSSRIIHQVSAPNLRFAGYNNFTLVDGIHGSSNPFDGRWVGYTGAGLNAVIDLGKLQLIKNIGFDFLEEKGLSIYLPLSVVVEISDDNRNFIRLISYSQAELSQMKAGNMVKVYKELSPVSMRYLRIIAINQSPSIDDDGKTYTLIDEISAN